jgi:DNA-binding transcriptional ArsR family regulator
MDILQRLFKSVSGKTRLEILLLLLEKGELSVGEIASSLKRKFSTISQNLRILEKDNFVRFRHDQGNVYYSIKLNSEKYPYNHQILEILKNRLKEIKKYRKAKR